MDMESALMAGQSISAVAKFYCTNYQALKAHKENCAPYLLSLDEYDALVLEELNKATNPNEAATGVKLPGSLQRQLGLREGDILAAMMQEYLITLKNIGRKINKFVNESDTAEGLSAQARFLRKPIMDAYTLMGGEIRQTAKTMAEIDKMLNAPEIESPTSGLFAVANAIKNSQQTVKTNSESVDPSHLGQPPKGETAQEAK